MAILDLQRREMEAGRIRFGNKVGNRPNRLDHPLLTSPDRELIEAVALAYRGEDHLNTQPWPGGEGQWQVEIDGDLDVLIPVQPDPVSQWWERWSGGGCMRRCDGVTDIINDQPCDCDKTAEKRACSATTRFVVLLPETGDARWRVETKSINAAMELPAALEAAVGERTGEVIPAVLSVVQRPGKKGKVPVPVIRITKSAGDSAPAEQAGSVALPASRVESPEPSVGAGSGDSPASVSGKHGGGQQPPTTPKGPEDPTAAPTISEAQRKRMMAKAREAGVSTDDLKAIVADIAKVTSSKDIPADKYDTVISAVENWATWQAQLVPERQEDVG
jgi:type III secretion system FlhB-like substrate exporter